MPVKILRRSLCLPKCWVELITNLQQWTDRLEIGTSRWWHDTDVWVDPKTRKGYGDVGSRWADRDPKVKPQPPPIKNKNRGGASAAATPSCIIDYDVVYDFLTSKTATLVVRKWYGTYGPTRRTDRHDLLKSWVVASENGPCGVEWGVLMQSSCPKIAGKSW